MKFRNKPKLGLFNNNFTALSYLLLPTIYLLCYLFSCNFNFLQNTEPTLINCFDVIIILSKKHNSRYKNLFDPTEDSISFGVTINELMHTYVPQVWFFFIPILSKGSFFVLLFLILVYFTIFMSYFFIFVLLWVIFRLNGSMDIYHKYEL